MELLKINHLNVVFDDIAGRLTAVHDVSLTLRQGEVLGVIGESGSGKSVTARAVMQLLNTGKKGSVKGEILFCGQDLLRLKEKQMCRVRGEQISMIFQEPMTALNPVMTVGKQIEELFSLHKGAEKADVPSVLRQMGIDGPEEMLRKYPFELSGGLRQRVVIAMAVLLRPKLIIADEPTTALDVTTQAEILELLRKVLKEIGCSILLITHDLGVIAEMAQRVLVMYRGIVVEACPVETLFDSPAHPYSQGLMASRPSNFNGRYYAIRGNVEQNYGPYEGCPYKDRCPSAFPRCKGELPPLREIAPGHFAACWLHTGEGAMGNER